MYMFREGNYLRVRGEYTPTRTLAVPGWELPPRARRIRAAVKPPHGERVNYLRVRGEYHLLISGLYDDVELPPRARRIRNAGR